MQRLAVRMQGLEPQLLVPETSVLPLDDIRFTIVSIPYLGTLFKNTIYYLAFLLVFVLDLV